MEYVQNVLFILLLFAGIFLFATNLRKLRRNILLGKPENRSDHPKTRRNLMFRIAIGQGKMTRRPIAGILHIFVYLGFTIINIEILEIIIDGIFGTHRFFGTLLPGFLYNSFTFTIEILALLVIISVSIFFIRRNFPFIHIKRLQTKELKGWAKKDANIILLTEFVLMWAFFIMNAADSSLQDKGLYMGHGKFPVSDFIFGNLFNSTPYFALVLIERLTWWIHFTGVLFFLNYLYYSKHLHILLAFPNTYFSDLKPKGELNNLASVTQEVNLMMDPTHDPYASSTPPEIQSEPEKFGACEATDLSWIQLMNAYTCTECGRCTAVCPANITGKKLSPRKIMMSVRDRIEDIGKIIDKHEKIIPDGKQLLGDYIKPEEIWACTTCNACVEACPVLINPVSIILDLRRYLVMEQSSASPEINNMFNNIENNNAPWQFNSADRANWIQE